LQSRELRLPRPRAAADAVEEEQRDSTGSGSHERAAARKAQDRRRHRPGLRAPGALSGGESARFSGIIRA
jgi:hypothetical protein